MTIIDVIVTLVLFVTMPFAFTGIVAILVNRSIDARARRTRERIDAERISWAMANPRPTR